MGLEFGELANWVSAYLSSFMGGMPDMKGKGPAIVAGAFFLFFPFIRSLLGSVLYLISSVIQSITSVFVSVNRLATTTLTAPINGATRMMQQPGTQRKGRGLILAVIFGVGITIGLYLPVAKKVVRSISKARPHVAGYEKF